LDGLKSVDEQLCYYWNMYPKSSVQIYLSDHGKDDFQTRFHTFMVITGDEYSPQDIDGLYCLTDFGKIFHSILNKEEILKECNARQYIELQEFDWISGYPISLAIKGKDQIESFLSGYRGVVTDKHIYIKFNRGTEWLIEKEKGGAVFEPIWYQREDDMVEISPELLEQYRTWAGETDQKLQNEICKYYPYIERIYRRAFDRNMNKIRIVNEIIRDLPKKKIALRTGGRHSYSLYSILTRENRRKIEYVIDRDPNCFCKKLHIKILQEPVNVDVIILSSFYSIEQLREEAKNYNNIKVIDLYSMLEEKGYSCRFPLYNFEPDINDYEVEFPFGDFG